MSNLNDFTYTADNLDQRASGTITIDDYTAGGNSATGSITVIDYTQLIGVAASATIVIDDYTQMIGTAATGTIDVDDYTKLIEAAATGTIQITDYTQLSGATFSINGNDYVEGVHFAAETNNDTTATNLAAVIDIDADLGASAVTDTITITAAAAGTAGNSIATTSDAGGGVTISGATLSGGQDHATVTVDGVTYTQGTDFNSVTDNDTTATNLAAAIDGGAQGAAAVTNQVTITAASIGEAGNLIDTTATYAAGGLTLSGATLSGGLDETVVTVNGTALTQGVDFTAGTSNDATATSLASAIDALANIGAAAVTDTITITADSVGVAGNAYTLSSVGSGGLTLSGATFTGGWDQGTITVGSDTLTQGSDFNAATDNDTTAGNLATAIDGLSGVSASATGSVISITNDTHGVAGNAKVLQTNQAGSVTLSGATLTGGVDSCTVTVGSDTLTEGTDFDAETDNDTTATNLAAAIDALGTYTASATDNVVTVYQTAPGTTGNAKVLQTSATSGIILSGATLLGGVDATYTDWFEVSEASNVEEILEVDTGGLSGTSPTIDVTPIYSFDKTNSHEDSYTFSQVTSAPASEALDRTFSGAYRRYKIQLGGSDTIWIAGRIHAIPKK